MGPKRHLPHVMRLQLVCPEERGKGENVGVLRIRGSFALRDAEHLTDPGKVRPMEVVYFDPIR